METGIREPTQLTLRQELAENAQRAASNLFTCNVVTLHINRAPSFWPYFYGQIIFEP